MSDFLNTLRFRESDTKYLSTIYKALYSDGNKNLHTIIRINSNNFTESLKILSSASKHKESLNIITLEDLNIYNRLSQLESINIDMKLENNNKHSNLKKLKRS